MISEATKLLGRWKSQKQKSPNFVASEIASGASGPVFYCIGIKYWSSLIESPSLKKILPRHQLTDLSKETLFLGDSGAHKHTQGLLRPNSCIVLIYGIWPIISAIKRIVLGFFCASQIPTSQAVQVKAKNPLFQPPTAKHQIHSGLDNTLIDYSNLLEPISRNGNNFSTLPWLAIFWAETIKCSICQ